MLTVHCTPPVELSLCLSVVSISLQLDSEKYCVFQYLAGTKRDLLKSFRMQDPILHTNTSLNDTETVFHKKCFYFYRHENINNHTLLCASWVICKWRTFLLGLTLVIFTHKIFIVPLLSLFILSQVFKAFRNCSEIFMSTLMQVSVFTRRNTQAC